MAGLVAPQPRNPLLDPLCGSGADAVIDAAAVHGDRLLALEAAVADIRQLCADRVDQRRARGGWFPTLVSVAAVLTVLEKHGIGV